MLAGIWAELLGVEGPGLARRLLRPGRAFAARGAGRVAAARGLRGGAAGARAVRGADRRRLAARVEPAARPEAPAERAARPRAARGRALPLSFAQERLWFLDQLEPGSPAYNMPAAVRLQRRRSTPRRWRGRFAEIVAPPRGAAHRVPGSGGRARPGGGAAAICRCPVVDLSGLCREACRNEALRLARRGPAAVRPGRRDRCSGRVLLRLGDGDHVLLVTVHHIAFDGWSMGVLVRELAALYGAATAAAAELPVQYADFAVWQRGWLAGEALERTARLVARAAGRGSAGARAAARPAAPAGPDVPRRRACGRPLRRPCRAPRPRPAAEATPFMTLLAVWPALLAALHGRGRPGRGHAGGRPRPAWSWRG